MSFFGVTIETISEITPHPGADRLSLAKCANLGFQFVIVKDSFEVGSKVAYFPLDAVLPDELIEKLGMVGKFSGSKRNKIKTILLRGEISQGYVTDPAKILPPEMLTATPEEITSFLGVTKYEPPIKITNEGELRSLPTGLSVYDIEGADRNQAVIDLLMDEEVIVMEKMEGTNHSIFISESKEIFVNSRNNTIIPFEGKPNMYWDAPRASGLLDFMVNEIDKGPFGIYSELCGPGIQGNIYKLPTLTNFIYDFKQLGEWMSLDPYLEIAERIAKKTQAKFAPILFRGKLRDFLNGRTVQEASNFKSTVNPLVWAEGIVIKPVKEQRSYELSGRLIIKQRSPIYLAGEKD